MADNPMPILQPLPFPLLTNKPRSSAQSASIRVPTYEAARACRLQCPDHVLGVFSSAVNR